MNCKQAEVLLPLYVSRDLDNHGEAMVAAHVRDCMNCGRQFAEYRAARQLLRESAPPVFAEGMFDEMRKNVWREIEAESAARSLSDIVASWFRPRLIAAVATAVLIVLSVLGFYLVTRRTTVEYEAAGVVPGHSLRLKGDYANVPSPKPSPKNARQAGGDRQLRTYRNLALTRSAPKVTATDASPVLPGASPIKGLPEESIASTAGDQRRPLRLEIQTKNPNIRIIWFAQRETKPVSPNTKGT